MSELERYIAAAKKGCYRYQLAPGKFAQGDDGKVIELPLHELMALAQRRCFDGQLSTGGTPAPPTETNTPAEPGENK